MNDLKLALAQTRPEPGNIENNAKTAAGYMRLARERGARFIVFAECSLTGYAPEKAAELALAADAPEIRSIEQLADELGIAVCFGYMEKSGPYISQELYCGGERTVYRKTHLAGREQAFFIAGNSFPAAKIRTGSADGHGSAEATVTAGMQLCWESHIPQISAEYRKNGAQLLLFPYASGMGGAKCKDNWSVHLPARASDNGCFAAACNLLGAEKGGGMAVWDPKGRLTAEYWGADENMLFCTIGGELPREIRSEGLETMHSISYFDRARSELFSPQNMK